MRDVFCEDHVLSTRVIGTGGTAVGTRKRTGVIIAMTVVVVAAVCVGIVLLTGGTAGGSKHPDLRGNGSVDEAWLTGAAPGDHITLTRNGTAVSEAGASGTADPLGSLIVRDLTPGTGYQWDDQTTGQTTPSFTVLAPGRNPGDQLVPLHGPAHARRAQLHHHAGRHQAGRHRALPLRRDLFGDQPLPHGHRVLRATTWPAPPTRSRTFLSEALAHHVQGLRRPESASRHGHRRGIGPGPGVRVRHGQPADAGDRLFGRRLRPLRLPVRLRRLRRHRDRGPPGLGGQPQGRDGRHQLLRASPSSRRRAPIRPDWPPSPR